MLGQYVNNYEVTGLLGEGGMGAVYAAQHRLINRKVAIKVLKRELSREPEVVQRFFNEARAIGTIRHPHIIEIIDVGKLPSGVPYLVMELLEGESLAERVTRLGPLPFDVIVDYAAQAACALEVAHERGIVHRDLKPENLFILSATEGQRETIKVLDFGIAKLRDDLTATPVHTRAGSLLGTPLYMSPEQCRGLSELDLRTDVYSLGVILYEAVCGSPPFLAKSVGEVMRMHMSEEPARPSELRDDVPPQLEFVILKCLAKEPALRFASMPEFSAALAQSGLASTEPDTPLQLDPRWKPTRSYPPQTPLAASNFKGQLAHDQRRTTPGRAASVRRKPLGVFLQLALWGFLLSLVALGAPEQPALHTSIELSVSTPLGAAASAASLHPALNSPEPGPGTSPSAPANVARPHTPRTTPTSLTGKLAHPSQAPANVNHPGEPISTQSAASGEYSSAANSGSMQATASPRGVLPANRSELQRASRNATSQSPRPAADSAARASAEQPQRSAVDSPQHSAPGLPRPAADSTARAAAEWPRAAGGGTARTVGGGAPRTVGGGTPRTVGGETPRMAAGEALRKAAEQPQRSAAGPPPRTAAEPEPFSTSEPSSSPGFLSLDSAPWSEVFLGESALGTTPLLRVPLPPGRHQLTLRNSELGASTTYVVEIKSGQSLARLVGWGK